MTINVNKFLVVILLAVYYDVIFSVLAFFYAPLTNALDEIRRQLSYGSGYWFDEVLPIILPISILLVITPPVLILLWGIKDKKS